MNFFIKGALGLSLLSLFQVAQGQEWGDPLPAFDAQTWNWVDIPDTYCRDGSQAGFMVNYSGKSSNVVIYLEGGGACFNNQTCGLSPAQARKTPPASEGIFDRDKSDNPVADWNVVYVPYCTGDVFSGSNDNGYVSSKYKNQKFVGYRNMTKFLERISPTFDSADKVLLTGISAGGFGAVWNFDQVQRSFGDIPVYLLDDSGVAFTDDYLSPCLQSKWRTLWGMNETVPEDCPDCTQENGGGLAKVATFLEDKYADREFAYISTMADATIRLFFGYGRRNCRVLFPYMPADTFRKGILQMRDEVLVNNSIFFLTEGTEHTAIANSSFYTRSAGDKVLNNWVGDFLREKATSLGLSM